MFPESIAFPFRFSQSLLPRQFFSIFPTHPFPWDFFLFGECFARKLRTQRLSKLSDSLPPYRKQPILGMIHAPFRRGLLALQPPSTRLFFLGAPNLSLPFGKIRGGDDRRPPARRSLITARFFFFPFLCFLSDLRLGTCYE